MVDCQFVGCRFRDCRFDGCSFHGVILKNVDVSDLVIDDPSISRVHASLCWVEGRLKLSDLASSNGTRPRCCSARPSGW